MRSKYDTRDIEDVYKRQEEYLYDDKALEKYRKTHEGPFTLQRYKGLGEMDAGQLWDCLLYTSSAFSYSKQSPPSLACSSFEREGKKIW